VVGLTQYIEGFGGWGGDSPGHGETLPHTEVARGPHIEAAELKHQEHLGRPLSNAPDCREASHDLVVALTSETPRLEDYGAVEDLGRQVLQRQDLVARQSRGSQVFGGGGEKTLGRHLIAQGVHQTTMDSLGGGACELLVGHGTNECREVCFGRSWEGWQAGVLDQTSDDRVAIGQNASRLTRADLANCTGGRSVLHRYPFWAAGLVRALTNVVLVDVTRGRLPEICLLRKCR
jgi:hypothetical protein